MAKAAKPKPTKAEITTKLGHWPSTSTVNELAEPFDITLQAVSKHIQVLEQAGLVSRSRDAPTSRSARSICSSTCATASR